jgi:hypothetical protein
MKVGNNDEFTGKLYDRGGLPSEAQNNNLGYWSNASFFGTFVYANYN